MTQPTRWPFEELKPKPAELSNLLKSHGAPIVEIVGEETCNIVHDASVRLQELSLKKADRHNVRSTKTKALQKSLDKAAEYLLLRRKSIETEFPDDDIRATFGLNVKIGYRSPQTLATAYDLFIKGGEKHPDLLKKAGVPASNLATMKETLQALISGDISQEGAKNEAKVSTAERNAAQLEVEAAMTKIVNGRRHRLRRTARHRRALQGDAPQEPQELAQGRRPGVRHDLHRDRFRVALPRASQPTAALPLEGRRRPFSACFWRMGWTPSPPQPHPVFTCPRRAVRSGRAPRAAPSHAGR